MKKLIAALTAAGLLSVGAIGTAGALEPAGGSDAGPNATAAQHPLRARWVALRIAARTAAATIDVPVTELRDAVRGGQTVAAFAESKGADPDHVEQAVVDALNGAIDKAVDAGRLDADRAAALRERVPRAADHFMHTVPKRFASGGAATT
jgi:hypothetical protein